MTNARRDMADELSFSLVRVAARLRFRRTSAARIVADYIQAELRDIPLRAAAVADTHHEGHPCEILGRQVRVTPELGVYLVTLSCLLQVTGGVSRMLQADEQMADLLPLLDWKPRPKRMN